MNVSSFFYTSSTDSPALYKMIVIPFQLFEKCLSLDFFKYICILFVTSSDKISFLFALVTELYFLNIFYFTLCLYYMYFSSFLIFCAVNSKMRKKSIRRIRGFVVVLICFLCSSFSTLYFNR